MCQIVVCPKNLRPTREALENAFDRNPDGAGFAYVANGEVVIQTAIFGFDEFYEAFSKIPLNKKALVHFRLSSVGAKKQAENCHPFFVGDDRSLCFAHNGTMKDFIVQDAPESDTVRFRDQILNPLYAENRDFLQSDPIRKMIDVIGHESKFVFFDKDEKFTIIGEQHGVFENGIWYSNKDHHMKKIIATNDAPKAVGPYSQAVSIGKTLYCAGQIPLDPANGEIVTGDIQAQTKRVLENLRAVLTGNQMTFENVVKTTVFMVDLGEFAAMNEIYAQAFAEPFPARSTIQVAALPKGARVEIEAVAVSE